jgi:hypothetical protein
MAWRTGGARPSASEPTAILPIVSNVSFHWNEVGLRQAAEQVRAGVERVVNEVAEQHRGEPAGRVEPILRAALTRAGLKVDDELVRNMAQRIAIAGP